MRIVDIFKFSLARFVGASGAKLRRPDGAVVGMPWMVGSSDGDRIIVSSGASNGTGQITLSTPLPFVPIGTPWIYLPPGVVAGDAVGGWRRVTFSTASVCQILGFPATANSGYTQTVSALTVMSAVVPGGSLGPNGELRFKLFCSYANSTNAKTIAVRFGGQAVWSVARSVAGQKFDYWDSYIKNKGSEGAQLAPHTLIQSLGYSGSLNLVELTVDTSVDQVFSVSGQLASALDYMVFSAVDCTVLYCGGA